MWRATCGKNTVDEEDVVLVLCRRRGVSQMLVVVVSISMAFSRDSLEHISQGNEVEPHSRRFFPAFTKAEVPFGRFFWFPILLLWCPS